MASPVYTNPAFAEHWKMALLKRKGQKPARIVIVSGSLSEMISYGGCTKSWCDMLGDRIFIPTSAEWGLGTNGNGADFWNPTKSTSGSFYVTAEVGNHSPVRKGTATAGGFIEWDVTEYHRVRPLIVKASWTGHPVVSIDDSTPITTDAMNWTVWDPSGISQNTILGPAFDVTAASSFKLIKPSVADLIVHGIVVDKTLNTEIQVLNLSRSGTTSAQWGTWFEPARDGDESMIELTRGFNHDLVAFGSWGNDFHEGVNQSTLNSRLDALYARLQVLCPNADFFTWNEPPAVDPNDPSFETAWNTFNQWIRDWNEANDIPYSDWGAYMPTSGIHNEYYGSDQTHGNVAFSQLIADDSAEIVLP